MSLNAIRRVACKIFNETCNCDSDPIPNVIFCTEITQTKKKLKKKKMTPLIKTNINEQDVSNHTAATDGDEISKEQNQPNSALDDKKPTGKVQDMIKRYGVLFVIVYLSLLIVTVVAIFLALDLDIINAAYFGLDSTTAITKACDYLEKTSGLSTIPTFVRDHPKVGTFVLAYLIAQFTQPFRLMIAVSVVPLISIYCSKVKAGE